jgi:hypothetical protein
LGCWSSPSDNPFSFGARFGTYEPFISLIFQFSFSGRSKTGILNQWIRGHDCIPVGFDGDNLSCHMDVAGTRSGDFVGNKNYCFIDIRREFVADDLLSTFKKIYNIQSNTLFIR